MSAEGLCIQQLHGSGERQLTRTTGSNSLRSLGQSLSFSHCFGFPSLCLPLSAHMASPAPQSRILQLLEETEARQRDRPSTTNLLQHEIFWRDQQVWLQEKGYMLRPRYHPNWIPASQGKAGPARIHEDTVCPLVRAFTALIFLAHPA